MKRMLGWLARGMLILGGVVASWFVSREANIYPVLTMVITLLLLTGLIALVSFWPAIRRWARESMKKDNIAE